MSLDFPDRSVWLARRATPARLRLGRFVWLSTRPVNLGAGQFGTAKVHGTYRVGANAVKRRMGARKQRRLRRKAMQRAERANLQGQKEAA